MLELNKTNKHMTSYEKFEKIMDKGFSKEDLWDEMTRWLDEYRLSEFADDFANNYDIEIKED